MSADQTQQNFIAYVDESGDHGMQTVDVLKKKFFCSGGREQVGDGFENWGLKIYPPLESEKPR